MDSHSSSKPASSGGFWPMANIALGLFFGLFALYWGVMLVGGGIAASRKLRAPEPEAAAPAAATTPVPATTATTATTTAAAPAASGPVAEITIKPDTTNPLAYDTKSFTVKAGQKVKFTFNNTHPSVPR
jgi:hypothetical protein